MFDTPVTPRKIKDKFSHAYDGDFAGALKGVVSGGPDTPKVVDLYEAALADWFGMPHALAVSSGGAALTVAFCALGVGPGDEVVLPPTCPLCTIFPIMQLGAVPVFCDTRKDSFGLDPDDLMRVLNDRTKLVVEVPMWGYPTELDELSAILAERGVPLVLDLAHSHGSTLGGKALAAYGDISCFSTHDRKPLATGEGGFMLFRDEEIADKARSFSRFGDLNGETFGLNCKLSPIQAALGLSRISSLSDQIEARRRNAAMVRAGLQHTPYRELPLLPGAEPNYYFMLVDLGEGRAQGVIDHLDGLGIPSDIKRYGCKALYKFPILEDYRRDCPQAEALLARITTIPVHPGLKDDDTAHIVSALKECAS